MALSEEAASLLRALVMRAQVWQGGWRPRHRTLHGRRAWTGYKAPIAPSEAMLDSLERVAAAHNRVYDLLMDARDERSSRLRTAADAGMGEALHLAATDRDGMAEVEPLIERMDELATRVESSVGRPRDVSVLRSNLDSTLEELRAEEVARRELGS